MISAVSYLYVAQGRMHTIGETLRVWDVVVTAHKSIQNNIDRDKTGTGTGTRHD